VNLDLTVKNTSAKSKLLFAPDSSLKTIEMVYYPSIKTIVFRVWSKWEMIKHSSYFTFLSVKACDFLLTLSKLGVIVKNGEDNKDIVNYLKLEYTCPKEFVYSTLVGPVKPIGPHVSEIFMHTAVYESSLNKGEVLNSFRAVIKIEELFHALECLGVFTTVRREREYLKLREAGKK